MCKDKPTDLFSFSLHGSPLLPSILAETLKNELIPDSDPKLGHRQFGRAVLMGNHHSSAQSSPPTLHREKRAAGRQDYKSQNTSEGSIQRTAIQDPEFRSFTQPPPLAQPLATASPGNLLQRGCRRNLP